MSDTSDSESELEIKHEPELSYSAEDYNLLPRKSGKKYEQVYKYFMDWQQNRETIAFTEEVLLEYFEEQATKMKSSTLWTNYSILKLTLNIKHGVDIKPYKKLLDMLKELSKGYTGKQSKILTSGQIKKFIKEAPDDYYLLMKVALIFGISGACSKNDLYKMSTKDMKDMETSLRVTVPDKRANTVRKFTVTGEYYDVCKKYINLRPRNASSNFFLHYHLGKCTNQNVGSNKFGTICKHIASFLKLPDSDLYTGQCFRRTATKLLKDAEEDEMKSTTVIENKMIEPLVGCFSRQIQNRLILPKNMLQSTENNDPSTSMNIQSVEGYVDHSIENLVDPLEISENNNPSTNMSIQFSTSSSDNHTAVHQLNFTNCTGITINISNPNDKVNINYL